MAKNPDFKRIPRTNVGSESVVGASNEAISLAEKVKKFTRQREESTIKQEKQNAKEFRQNTVGTLGEVTERFIQEGFSEDDAFREATNIIDEVDSDPNFQARGGFMGLINTKSKFTVGEKNKREFVSVKPQNDFNFFGNPTKRSRKKSNNNIFDVGF